MTLLRLGIGALLSDLDAGELVVREHEYGFLRG